MVTFALRDSGMLWTFPLGEGSAPLPGTCQQWVSSPEAWAPPLGSRVTSVSEESQAGGLCVSPTASLPIQSLPLRCARQVSTPTSTTQLLPEVRFDLETRQKLRTLNWGRRPPALPQAQSGSITMARLLVLYHNFLMALLGWISVTWRLIPKHPGSDSSG